MNKNIRTLALCGGVAALAATAQAQITFSESTVGSSTLFPTASISGNNGSLAFSDINSSVTGDTIAGGVSQGVGSSAGGYSWGETFLWTSGDAAVNGSSTLGAFSMVVNAAASGNVYTPFLYDLGAGPGAYNGTSFSFNTSTEVNLLDGSSITMSGLAAGPQSFLEFDFAGSDQATLVAGQEYAFGLLQVGTEGNAFFQRSNGAQADPNGSPFATSIAPTDAYAAYGGGPRNEFVGLYTVPVPEPGTMALTGLGGLLGMLVMRRRK